MKDTKYYHFEIKKEELLNKLSLDSLYLFEPKKKALTEILIESEYHNEIKYSIKSGHSVCLNSFSIKSNKLSEKHFNISELIENREAEEDRCADLETEYVVFYDLYDYIKYNKNISIELKYQLIGAAKKNITEEQLKSLYLKNIHLLDQKITIKSKLFQNKYDLNYFLKDYKYYEIKSYSNERFIEYNYKKINNFRPIIKDIHYEYLIEFVEIDFNIFLIKDNNRLNLDMSDFKKENNTIKINKTNIFSNKEDMISHERTRLMKEIEYWNELGAENVFFG